MENESRMTGYLSEEAKRKRAALLDISTQKALVLAVQEDKILTTEERMARYQAAQAVALLNIAEELVRGR